MFRMGQEARTKQARAARACAIPTALGMGGNGAKRSGEYRCWSSMVQRCTNPKDTGFADYGGRGIGLCDEWRGRGGFARFYGHIGSRPSPSHSIDRINNELGYQPSNVRWATPVEQAHN